MKRLRLTSAELERIVDEVVASLPPACQPWLENLVIDIEPYPSREIQDKMKLASRRDTLMGLFIGAPITEQGYGEHFLPNRVILFQRAIESACRSLAEVRYELRKTLIHELAHHFGYSESDLEDFEARLSPFQDDGDG